MQHGGLPQCNGGHRFLSLSTNKSVSMLVSNAGLINVGVYPANLHSHYTEKPDVSGCWWNCWPV